jgi:hypothetical protein
MTVAKASTGKYTLTLADKVQKLISVDADIMKSALLNVKPQWAHEDVNGTKVINLWFYTVDRSPNVLADPVSCTLWLRVELEESGV